jgi:hypothetical protein
VKESASAWVQERVKEWEPAKEQESAMESAME